MFARLNPAWLVLGGSLVLFGALALLLFGGSSGEPLIVYAAAGLRPPLEVIVTDFERESGIRVELRFGGSETILSGVEASLKTPQPADLFLPADDSYIEVAHREGLVNGGIPVARMYAVAAFRPGFPKPASDCTWADLTAPGVRLALANPDVAAIGKLTRDRLSPDRWKALEARTVVLTATVSEVANAVQLGSADAGLIWEPLARQYPTLGIARLPELAPVTAEVQVAAVKASKRPDEADRFVRFLTDPNKGQTRLREFGYPPP